VAGCAGLSVVTLGGGSLLGQSAPQLRAGAAKVEITPGPSELALPTDSIRDPLYVRALVVDNGSTCAVLVGTDQGGVRNDVVEAVLASSPASTGCPAENYALTATHTHSGSTGGLGGAGSPTSDTIRAAMISAIDRAKANLAPARLGYGTAQVDLNVNRDLYNDQQEWRQGPNREGVSDKTLAVVALVGEDGVPIGVMMNYAMHPINYYLSGVISADFPGDASRYVEDLFDGRTVALFTQGASGDQNPRLGYSAPYSTRSFRRGEPAPTLTVGPVPPPPENSTPQGFNPANAAAERPAVSDEAMASYKKVLGRLDDYVTMLGHMLGSTAVRVMREDMDYEDTAAIWGGQRPVVCPGRTRLDAADPARENVFPGYDEGPNVELSVGLIRLGDIYLVKVNGEVYTNIALNLKRNSPASRTVMLTLANGRGNSGYIYSDDAYHHLTFQVIGSRLEPGCAEGKIVSTALELIDASIK
jgi:hypothetical protein